MNVEPTPPVDQIIAAMLIDYLTGSAHRLPHFMMDHLSDQAIVIEASISGINPTKGPSLIIIRKRFA